MFHNGLPIPFSVCIYRFCCYSKSAFVTLLFRSVPFPYYNSELLNFGQNFFAILYFRVIRQFVCDCLSLSIWQIFSIVQLEAFPCQWENVKMFKSIEKMLKIV